MCKHKKKLDSDTESNWGFFEESDDNVFTEVNNAGEDDLDEDAIYSSSTEDEDYDEYDELAISRTEGIKNLLDDIDSKLADIDELDEEDDYWDDFDDSDFDEDEYDLDDID